MGMPTFSATPLPPLRRPPGPLKLGPSFRVPTRPAETIRFRFRTRSLRATATLADDIHHNVWRLQVHPSTVQRFIQGLVALLPPLIRVWFESSFPEWNLPSRLILKQQKEGWDEEFEMEKATYAKLRPLQGTVIPEFFGQLRYGNTKALLLSDIGGACLATPEGSLLEVADFRRMLSQALAAMSQFGILHGDPKLDNFHLTGDKIMMVDFESVSEEPLTDKQLEVGVESIVNFLAAGYEDNQYCYWDDGLIAIHA
ncbi:hypothetical protein ACRALDRAFT_1075753 [Sodiomyces alcalophilus JCM 7366]|uniref:uncharacterized protein n=1 Tax=Sodiomyces alcalophilus JCM 7366 TaxID=591952 RepID=UPI0039B5B182